MKDISLTDYIQIRHAVYLPHTAGRYAKKQFKKAQMPIVERLVDRLAIILSFFRRIDWVRFKSDDEGSQQWQKTSRSTHCCTCVRDHPPPHGPEPNPSWTIFSTSVLFRFADMFPSCRFLSMPLSTLALVKILHGSVRKVLSVAKLLMFHLCEESIKLSPF